jgi:YggT family protein
MDRTVHAGGTIGSALLYLINSLIDLIVFIVIVNAVVSWLIVFGVLNIRNPNVNRVLDILDKLTAPLLAPIRRFMPNLGGVDISPIILILLLQALRILIDRTIAGPLIAALG